MSKKAREVVSQRAIALLSAAYGWGAKKGYVPEGIGPSGIDRRIRKKARERFLTADEMARLGDTMREAETVGFAVNAGDPETRSEGPTHEGAPFRDRRDPLDHAYRMQAARFFICAGRRSTPKGDFCSFRTARRAERRWFCRRPRKRYCPTCRALVSMLSLARVLECPVRNRAPTSSALGRQYVNAPAWTDCGSTIFGIRLHPWGRGREWGCPSLANC